MLLSKSFCLCDCDVMSPVFTFMVSTEKRNVELRVTKKFFLFLVSDEATKEDEEQESTAVEIVKEESSFEKISQQELVVSGHRVIFWIVVALLMS